jgi:hypothetical protein
MPLDTGRARDGRSWRPVEGKDHRKGSPHTPLGGGQARTGTHPPPRRGFRYDSSLAERRLLASCTLCRPSFPLATQEQRLPTRWHDRSRGAELGGNVSDSDITTTNSHWHQHHHRWRRRRRRCDPHRHRRQSHGSATVRVGRADNSCSFVCLSHRGATSVRRGGEELGADHIAALPCRVFLPNARERGGYTLTHLGIRGVGW